MRIALFELASGTARFPTRSSATPGQVPRLVQRQTSGGRTRVRGWTLSGGRAADCELRLFDHELADFVMWISRPRSPVRKCQLGLSSRALSSRKAYFFVMNHRRTKTKGSWTRFIGLACSCYADLASFEATINKVNRGRIKTGREKDERWRKNISAPVSQKERGESRSWIPE